MSMLKKDKQGYYFFEKFKGLIHGISSRKFDGKKLLAALSLKKENLVLMEQVHGNKIKVVGEADKGKTMMGVDGLMTSTPGVILGVKTADCLPMIFYEPEAKIIGIGHAGWRGVLARLPQKMIDRVVKMGGLPENLFVGIGPHICGQCYSVEKTRSQRFLAEFGKLEGMVRAGRKKDLLDLAVPAKGQLISSGVTEKNIEFGGFCTLEQNKEFFSYRKDRKETYGEMLTVVALR